MPWGLLGEWWLYVLPGARCLGVWPSKVGRMVFARWFGIISVYEVA